MSEQALKEIAEKLLRKSEGIDPATVDMSRGKRGAIVGYMNKYFGGDHIRHSFCAHVFGIGSTKALSDVFMEALYTWIDPTLDDGQYIPSLDFLKDCADIRKHYGVVPHEILVPKVSIFDSHCSKHGENGKLTAHLYMGASLVCLECYPEKDYRNQYRLDAEPD